jgi:hypothetical protein
VMAEMMEAEVTEVAGVKGRHDPDRTHTRHGGENGSVTLGGRRPAGPPSEGAHRRRERARGHPRVVRDVR